MSNDSVSFSLSTVHLPLLHQATVVLSGNGMYNRWQTNEALINSNEQDDFYSTVGDDADGNSSHPLYDFGACSVHQLLAGYDNYLQYGNDNGAYSDDGNNPCLVDENYYRYVGNKYAFSNAPSWDYVVLADQSKRMAASSDMARYDTIDALVNVYAPLLLQAGSIPVIVDTHAFWSSHTNMTGKTGMSWSGYCLILMNTQSFSVSLLIKDSMMYRPLRE